MFAKVGQNVTNRWKLWLYWPYGSKWTFANTTKTHNKCHASFYLFYFSFLTIWKQYDAPLYVLQVEEAKLINQLAEINAIDYGLYKQAYETSLDVSEIVDQYEISKLLKGPFDMAGACLVIKAGPKGMYPKVW